MRSGRIRGSRGVAALVALAIVSVLSIAAGADGDIPVQFEGRVQWIAGEVLTVATDDDQSIRSISPGQGGVLATSIEAVEP